MPFSRLRDIWCWQIDGNQIIPHVDVLKYEIDPLKDEKIFQMLFESVRKKFKVII